MTIENMLKSKKVLLLPALLLVHHLLLFFEYEFYKLLPIVHMGERSWPLYFFILDGITVLLVSTAIIQFFTSKTKQWLYWGLIVILLIFPLISIYATFSDLTRKLCKNPQCDSYISGPDLSKIKLEWEN